MLFKRFKLQLPANFRKGEEVPGLARVIEDVCVCGCTVSAHSTATVRTCKRVRFPHDVLRVDIRWRRCSGEAYGNMPGEPCHCPGFWKKS